MFDTPVQVSRPSRFFDGEGSLETLGTATTVWADVKLHDTPVRMVFRAEEDIRVGDIIEVENLES